MFAPAIILKFILCIFFGFVHGNYHIEKRQTFQDQSQIGPPQRITIPYFAYDVDATTLKPFAVIIHVIVGDSERQRYYCESNQFEEGATAGIAPLRGGCAHREHEWQQYSMSFQLWEPLPTVVGKSWGAADTTSSRQNPRLEGKFNLQLVLTDF